MGSRIHDEYSPGLDSVGARNSDLDNTAFADGSI